MTRRAEDVHHVCTTLVLDARQSRLCGLFGFAHFTSLSHVDFALDVVRLGVISGHPGLVGDWTRRVVAPWVREIIALGLELGLPFFQSISNSSF